MKKLLILSTLFMANVAMAGNVTTGGTQNDVSNLQSDTTASINQNLPANAPNAVNTQSIGCPSVVKHGGGAQGMTFGLSFGGSYSIVDVCVALAMEDYETARKLMCLKSDDYAKVNESLCGGLKKETPKQANYLQR